MRVALYSPYLDTLGGGERYLATLAEFLSKKEEVDFFWDDKNIVLALQERFGLSFGNIGVCPDIFSKKTNFLKKFQTLRQYDLAIFLSDGSIPIPSAKTNILHFQVPFTLKNGQSLTNRIKLLGYKAIVCNSGFTKKYIDKTYGISSKVIYPPVDISFSQPARKKNIILSVGRFTKIFGGKKQEVLIEVFKEATSNAKLEFKNWQLYLAGGIGDKEYFFQLQKKAKGLPIEFFPDIQVDYLKKLYSEAKIYWHATGFGEDLEKYPERAEHFGISVVEAMAAGCVPCVFNGGGLKEIVVNTVNGFLWSNSRELFKLTKELVASGELMDRLSKQAKKDAQKFSKERFIKEFNEILL